MLNTLFCVTLNADFTTLFIRGVFYMFTVCIFILVKMHLKEVQSYDDQGHIMGKLHNIYISRHHIFIRKCIGIISQLFPE